MKKIVAAIIALVLAGCSTIQGVVRDKQTGSPVASAIVSIDGKSDTTDAIGRYQIDGSMEPGDVLMVNAPGYNLYTKTIKKSDEIIDVELTPKN